MQTPIGDFVASDISVVAEDVQCAYASALSAVEHLIALHGRCDVREFLAQLKTQSEARAFKAAFDQSLRAFERRWHERLRCEYAEREG